MKDLKVLIVDDEEELVETFVDRLAIRGIAAEAVTDGHDALERIYHTPFNVVVADLKMPGLSGEEIINILRSKYPEIKIILITGHGSVDEASQALVDSVEKVLMKPFNIDDLVKAIKEAVEKD